MFEFCKRWFFKGEEISPFAVSTLINTWKSYPLLVAALMGESHKGLIPASGIRKSILNLLSRFKRRSRLRKRISQKAYYVELLAKLFQGKALPSEVVSNI